MAPTLLVRVTWRPYGDGEFFGFFLSEAMGVTVPARNGSQVENFGVPWESSYGYVQAIRHGDTIYVSGQLANKGSELVAPAPVDGNGKVIDFSNMGEQMRQSYVNAQELLARFGASLDDVVEEVLYVLDIPAAFEVAGPVRKAAYGRQDPQVASTIVGVTGLAFLEQLIEIRFTARI
ncbi:RidA family protein [Streptomyces chiangmaiensis]|uniref:Rid family hydrolase n=1 Tax=Streptomyces chiangmaiensis TaxID=766497 RepID=A0ABU7FWR9_9ACTN|nr:Rid family hydrolase [Streptomyces chiangmaiensis]MED7827529.1 Rid family hydrolase [Streptomyces chiangmaiensis]